MIKMVIFDNDGTLINSEDILASVEDELLAEYGMSYTIEERAAFLIGVSYDAHKLRIEADYFALHNRDLPADFWDRLHERDHARMKTHLKAIDGAPDLVQAFKEASLAVAVASNGERNEMAMKLKATDLYDLFAPRIYSRDDVINPKPAPDVCLLAAREAGVHPSQCVFVDDTAAGVKAGVAAGMHVIGFTGGYEGMTVDGAALLAAGAHEIAGSMAEIQKRVFAMIEEPKPRGPTPPSL